MQGVCEERLGCRGSKQKVLVFVRCNPVFAGDWTKGEVPIRFALRLLMLFLLWCNVYSLMTLVYD